MGVASATLCAYHLCHMGPKLGVASATQNWPSLGVASATHFAYYLCHTGQATPGTPRGFHSYAMYWRSRLEVWAHWWLRLRPPHRRIGEARCPGPSGSANSRILVANATSLEASWPAIRLDPWDCLLVQESRLPALSWLRTELRQKGWRYLCLLYTSDAADE